MKKITSIIAALAIIISAASCSNGNNQSVSSVSETEAVTEASSESSSDTTAQSDTPVKTEIKFDGAKYVTYASLTPE